jgi:PTS system beta-glucosides-specific IIC component
VETPVLITNAGDYLDIIEAEKKDVVITDELLTTVI